MTERMGTPESMESRVFLGAFVERGLIRGRGLVRQKNGPWDGAVEAVSRGDCTLCLDLFFYWFYISDFSEDRALIALSRKFINFDSWKLITSIFIPNTT